MQVLRCFVAAPFPARARRAVVRLQQELASKLGDGVRWERPENLHMTLKFLGDVGVDQVREVAEAVEAAAIGSHPALLEPESVDVFPNPARPRVVVLRFCDPKGCAGEAAARLEASFERIGFPRERRSWTPHLTLGRMRRGAQFGDLGPELAELPPHGVPAVALDSLVLYQSELAPRGATYTALCEYPLEGGDEEEWPPS